MTSSAPPNRQPSQSSRSNTPNSPRFRSSQPSPSPSEDLGDNSIHVDPTQNLLESDVSGDENASAQSVGSRTPLETECPRASSSDSSRAVKRKALFKEDEFIKANPELYGLRRSVSENFFVSPLTSRLTSSPRLALANNENWYVRTRLLFVGSTVHYAYALAIQIDSSDSESDAAPSHRRMVKRRRVEKSQPCKTFPLPFGGRPCLIRRAAASKRESPALQKSSNESDSDSDIYGGARAKTLQRKARLQREAQPELAFAEKRWSSRRAAQQVQQGAYEESDFEDDEDAELGTAYYVADYIDDSPYVEKVVKHRLKDGLELQYDSSRYDFEYFVKWQGKSHLHDTWEPIESLRNVRGFRKVENYFRKFVEQELDIRFGDDVPPETKEQFFLDRERDDEAFEDYTQAERVVAVRDGDGEPEYLVKWKGLTYEECTWEVPYDIGPKFQDKIDQYLDRASRSWTSDRRETHLDTRGKMVKLDEQPAYITGGELRQFQLRGLNFLCLNWVRGNNVILADEMGLGKTVQTVSFLSWLRNDRRQEGPSIVVAPLSVIPAWCDTFNYWAPDLNYVVYLGPEDARSLIREHELLIDGNPKRPKFNVLVTSYEFILQDWQFLQTIKWHVLAVDEAHRLKNRESQLYLRLLNFGVPCKVLITGTPIQNNLEELSSLLDFLNPGKVNISGDFESLSSSDAQEKLQELHQAIAPYILRRTKETVESDLPPKIEKIIRVELSDVQLDYYKNILTRNYSALCDATGGQRSSLLNIMMELKKISNHPYMFPGAEERVLAGSIRREDQIKGLIASSGKMMLLDQLLSKLKKDGHRVLIFSQMVRMLDILGDYLSLRGYKFQRLDGTIAAGPRRMAINHFNADDSEDFCFLLSTRAGGLGINLMTADTVVIFDSDWNPQADLQAMARAHRIGQKKPVNIYRLVSKETVEEEVLERARNKLLLEYLTIQAGVTDDAKEEFKEKLNQKGLKTDGPSSAEDIQMVLKMRSSKMFEQSGNQERLEQLDIDSILENAEVTKTKVDDKINLSSGGIDWDNFMQITDVKVEDINLDWDQIIPAEKLAEIKVEEEKRQNEEYLAKIAAENAPRRATIKGRRSRETERADRLKKRQREQEQEEEEQRELLADPKRPLNDKEQRNLIKAYFRFGSMEDRAQDIIQEAKLGERDPDFVKSVLDDFIRAAQQAVDENNEKVADEEKKTGKSLTKKDRKAVLIDFGELKKVNAETAIERPKQLQLLRQAIRGHSDWRTFRLPEATKATNYSCPWGAKEDGMLLAGIDKHGFGAWVNMRDDPDLGLSDKLFLEEHRIGKKEERSKANDRIKAPGAVHLVRRAEYLLSVLQSKSSGSHSAPRAVDNHHRTNRKQHVTNDHRGGSNAPPASHHAKKRDRDRDHGIVEHHRHRRSEDHGTSRPDNKRKHSREDSRSPKHRRSDDPRRSGKHGNGHDHVPKRRYQDDDDRWHERYHHREDPRRHGESSRDKELRPQDERRATALRRLDELRRIGDHKEQRDRNNDAMIWFLLKPVRENFERILSTTKDKVRSSKERASIFGVELVVIGTFLDEKLAATAADESLKNNFWYVAGLS